MMRRSPPLTLQRGVAAVEAALLLVPLVTLALGIAEGGRVVYQYNTVAKATRDAARYLSTVEAGTGHAVARCLAVTGTRDCSSAALVDGLEVEHVSICDATNCAATHRNVLVNGNGAPATGVMNLVTVTVSGYQSANFMPLPTPWIEFDPISTTMRQAL
jgi:Flp pilus assembly protein TadG